MCGGLTSCLDPAGVMILPLERFSDEPALCTRTYPILCTMHGVFIFDVPSTDLDSSANCVCLLIS